MDWAFSRRGLLQGLAATGAVLASDAAARPLGHRPKPAGWVFGRMTGSEALCEALLAEGVGCVYGIPGAQENELWDEMKSPRAWESLVRAGHFTYSDLCTFDVKPIGDALSLDVDHVLSDGCGPDNTPHDIAFPLIRTGAVGFLNVHLRGSTAS